jgi:hypothetical protein
MANSIDFVNIKVAMLARNDEILIINVKFVPISSHVSQL